MSEYRILSDLYNSFFQPQVSSPEVLVDYHLWNTIHEALPEGYVLPDPRIIAELSRP